MMSEVRRSYAVGKSAIISNRHSCYHVPISDSMQRSVRHVLSRAAQSWQATGNDQQGDTPESLSVQAHWRDSYR